MKKTRQGSALILVLWSLLLLGIAIFGVVDIIGVSIEHAAQHENALEAEALAQSGLAYGLNPQIQKDDPLLHQQIDGTHHFSVKLTSEGAHLNLNYLLKTGHREVLLNLFTQWGVKLDEADSIVDALTDWISSPDHATLNGAEDSAYALAKLPQRPSHAPFVSLAEVDLVFGMEVVRKVRPQWQESFTLWSDGPINLNEAEPDLIQAVFKINPERIKSFIERRNGADHLVGTKDDLVLKDLKELQANLGLTDEQLQQDGNLVAFTDSVRRIESQGQAGPRQVKLEVVTRLNTNPPEYYLWSQQSSPSPGVL